MSIHIGTSGWSYDHWQSVLYPEGTFGTERLNYYIGHFGTVELNSSYYHWPEIRRLPLGAAVCRMAF